MSLKSTLFFFAWRHADTFVHAKYTNHTVMLMCEIVWISPLVDHCSQVLFEPRTNKIVSLISTAIDTAVAKLGRAHVAQFKIVQV